MQDISKDDTIFKRTGSISVLEVAVHVISSATKSNRRSDWKPATPHQTLQVRYSLTANTRIRQMTQMSSTRLLNQLPYRFARDTIDEDDTTSNPTYPNTFACENFKSSPDWTWKLVDVNICCRYQTRPIFSLYLHYHSNHRPSTISRYTAQRIS